VGKAKIAIYDMNGKKLHSRKVKANEDLLVPYDMNSLPCAEYKVMITTDEEEVTYTVETVEKEKPVEALPLMAYGKKVDENTINLLVIGLDQAGTEVKIKRVTNDRIVHEEIVNQTEGFKKNYKLNGLDPEDVYFEVTDATGRTRQIYF
jgi:hypothetical protein